MTAVTPRATLLGVEAEPSATRWSWAGNRLILSQPPLITAQGASKNQENPLNTTKHFVGGLAPPTLMTMHIQSLLDETRRKRFKAYTGSLPNPFGVKALAHSIGIAPSTLSKLRTYEHRWPQLATAVAMANALGITPDEVFEAVKRDLTPNEQTSDTDLRVEPPQ